MAGEVAGEAGTGCLAGIRGETVVEEEICAGGFVVRGGKVLALRRWNGVWLPPKGHLEPGETLENAVRREVCEETGLAAAVGPRLGEHAYAHSEDGRLHRKRVHWFLAHAETGEVRLEEGMFDAYLWLGPDELETFTFESDRELARKALCLDGPGGPSQAGERRVRRRRPRKTAPTKGRS